MKTTIWLGSLALAAGLMVGCDNSSTTTPATPAAPSTATPGGGSTDAAKPAGDAAATVDAAAAEATKEATSLYEQAMAAVKAQKWTDAESILAKLEALKSKLPADWAAKIDQLKSAIETGKKAMGSLPKVPGT